MLDIMKSIYDMMGKYTYPALREEAPREHVESFFQVPGTGWAGFGREGKEVPTGNLPEFCLPLSRHLSCFPTDDLFAEDGQKQGWCGDY